MADQSGEKTQEPTQHRRDQAREQGQVAMSQDLGSAVLLVAAVLLLMYWGRSLGETTASIMAHELGTLGPLATDPAEVVARSRQLLTEIARAVLPIIGLLMVASAAASVFQVGFLFVPSRLSPDLSRISPASGFKRLFSTTSVARLSFGLFKVLIVSAVSGVVVYLRRDEVLYCSHLSCGQILALLCDVALQTALWVAIALLVLALGDYAFQRWKHEQDLKMSNQEVREEMKNLQGNPEVIARRRAIQRQMALNRIGEKVPQADVVVTNPTELSVAIQYDADEMAAPVVVAKGAGLIAQRIRRLALENNIPVVERKPLARSLYKDVEVGHPVPDSSYAAVAEVLAYVYQLKGKKPPPQRAA
ncbi:MAG: flagellar biosynthesis protein FlhB [Planctomycetota bacterium]